MKDYLKQIVKSSNFFYKLYFFLGSFCLRLLGLFVATDENLILMVVYGGQRYDDSPRFIYEYMKTHPAYKKYKFKWAFIHPETVLEVPDHEKIKIDTFSYYVTALKAKYWITNSSASRGLNFQKKKTVNILFQHGMAGLKLLGTDIVTGNQSFKLNWKEKLDYIFIEGKKEKDLLISAWGITEQVLYPIGLPRNDDLVGRTRSEIDTMKEKLGIPLEKKVILYAPTFREYNRDSEHAIFLRPPFDFDYWERELADEYVLLMTAHYEVAKLMNIPSDHPFVINAFQYPHINDLMLVSDLLISDYSSIIWDYSILGKPILSFAYDLKQYREERGLYDGYESIFSHEVMETEEEVVNYVKTMDYARECEYTKQYIRDQYLVDYGNITEKCVNILFSHEAKNEKYDE